jgi:hypothetical protein
MNERILELAKQAGIKANSEQAMSPQEQLFAELIVKECANICDGVAIQHDNNNETKAGVGAWDCRSTIKEHFGVEE